MHAYARPRTEIAPKIQQNHYMRASVRPDKIATKRFHGISPPRKSPLEAYTDAVASRVFLLAREIARKRANSPAARFPPSVGTCLRETRLSYSRRMRLRKPDPLSFSAAAREARKREIARLVETKPAASRRGRRVNTTIDFSTLPCPAQPNFWPRYPARVKSPIKTLRAALLPFFCFFLLLPLHDGPATGIFRGGDGGEVRLIELQFHTKR